MTQKYIVIFKESASDEKITNAKKQVEESGGEITQEYNMPGMKGFAAAIPDSLLSSLQSLQSDGVIDTIEPDGEVTIQKK